MQPGTVLKKNIWCECPSPKKYRGVEWPAPKGEESSAEWGGVWGDVSPQQPTGLLQQLAGNPGDMCTVTFNFG